MKKIGIIIILSYLISCTAIEYKGNSKILNRELVSQINKGDTIEKIEKIFGRPNSEYTAGGNVIYDYSFSRQKIRDKYVEAHVQKDSKNLTITFRNGKVDNVDYILRGSVEQLVAEDKRLNRKIRYKSSDRQFYNK